MIFVFSVFDSFPAAAATAAQLTAKTATMIAAITRLVLKKAAKYGMNTMAKSTNAKAAVQLLTVRKQLRQSLWIAWDSKTILILNS